MYKRNGSVFASWQREQRGKMKHISNAFGKWFMICPHVPNLNSHSLPVKTTAFIFLLISNMFLFQGIYNEE